MSQPLWTPSPDRVARAKMTAFMREAEPRHGVSVPDYARLYRFSIDRPADFWRLIWDFAGVRGTMGERVIEDPDRMPGAQLSRRPDQLRRKHVRRRDDAPAIIFHGEGRRPRTLTYPELFTEVLGAPPRPDAQAL